MFEKFFTHRTRNNFEAFHGIESAQPQASVGHKNLGRASKLFLTLYILVKTCADLF